MASNQTTLKTYQDNFDKYIAGTPQEVSGTQKEWLERVLDRVDRDASILEIGSAFGRDARYMMESGYGNLTVTDAFDAAVRTLNENGFADAKKLNILTDELDGEYGLVYASAVFLHFNEQEFESVLDKAHRHLGAHGLLAFTVKQGEGEEWSDAKMSAPRFFHYWQEEPLRQTVQRHGYKILELVTNEEHSQKWLAVTCTPESL